MHLPLRNLVCETVFKTKFANVVFLSYVIDGSSSRESKMFIHS